MIIDMVIVVVLIGAAFALGFILGWNAFEARIVFETYRMKVKDGESDGET